MVSASRVLAALAAGLCLVATSAQTFCSTAPAKPGDRRPDTTQLKFATYNTEFLFLVGYGNLDCPGADCKWSTVAKAKSHIRQTAANIKALNADILQLNEVEDCAVLDALITELQALGDSTYKPYVIKGTDSATGQNSALLTRVDPIVNLARSANSAALPVANSTCPPASGYPKTKSVAKHFYTTFKVSGFSKPITLIGAHLLANPSNKVRCYEREGQATVLNGLAANAASNGNHVIISGDMNDFSRTSVDKNNNQPISNAMGILEKPGFFNAGTLAAKAERFSQWWDKNNDCVYVPTEVSSLDHVVLSNSLRSGVTSVAFRNDLYDGMCSSFNSDHWPITVTLRPV